jgi:GNAT superfamily N-acetyltransferase
MAQLGEQSTGNEILWSGNVKGTRVEIKPVTTKNVEAAIDIAAQCFPGEPEQVVKSFQSSVRPREQWTFEGANDLDRLEYYLLYANGKPAGVSGAYVLKDQPKESWVGWTGLSYLYRGLGLGKAMVDFVENKVAKEGQETLRAWSVKTTSGRFDDMRRILEKMWGVGAREVFSGGKHSFGKYYIFSTGLNGRETTCYPVGVVIAGGSDNEAIQETPMLLQIKDAEKRFMEQRRLNNEKRAAFLAEYGSVEAYLVSGRIVDLSDKIARQVHDTQTESLRQLNDKLFPVEEERENVFGEDGLKLYVKPDRSGKYAPNERRALAVLDEKKEKVIEAIVYGIVALPENLRREEKVDGALGITYLMVDENDRNMGVGKALVETAKAKSADFLRNRLGVTDPKIMTLTEQNDPANMTLGDCVNDFSGVLLGPISRLAFWASDGLYQRRVNDFPYVQTSLRKGLEPCEGLGLYFSASLSIWQAMNNLLNYQEHTS